MHNLSHGDEFDLVDNESGRKMHFHMKGCAARLVLRQGSWQFGNDLMQLIGTASKSIINSTILAKL